MTIRQPIITVLGHVDHGKCVAKGTKVFLANGELVPVEKLFEDGFASGRKILQEDGIVVELENPLFVLGEEQNKVKEMMVSHVWKLKKNTLIKVKAENGFEIETTPEHPFPVLNEKFGVSYVKATDISENSYILVPKKLCNENKSIEPIKSEILKKLSEKDFLAFVDKSFATALHKIPCSLRRNVPLYNFSNCRFRANNLLELCNNRFSSEQTFDSITAIKQSTRKWRAGHTSKKMVLPKTVDEFKRFFYFSGLFFGDGDNSTGKLCNNDIELLTEYKKICEEIFEFPCKIQKGHTCLEASPNSGKTLTKFLQAVFGLPTGKKSSAINVSKILEIAPNEFVAEFIKGYFDTDGYVEKNGVAVTSNSKKMVEGLAYLLLRFNVRCFVRKNKKAFCLTIKGRENVQNFAEKIGFNLPAKNERLEKYLKICTSSRVLGATSISGNQTKALRKEFGIGNKRLKISFLEKTETYSTVSFNFLREFGQKLDWVVKSNKISSNADALNSLENLNLLLDGNLGFSKIVKKEIVQNDYGYVFDLSQPKTHNFIANGFLIHNTTLLDSIRGTTVADREAGAITQHIGATEVPLNVIEKISGNLIKKYGFQLNIPGLLFIDTPGHEAFTNLRKRGGSIADLAVLVVDITQGFQNQTIEAIDILRSFKTPFIVAANKVDKLFDWNSNAGEFSANLKNQSDKGLRLVDEKVYEIVGKLFELGFQSDRFDRCTDFSKQIPIVPISAKTMEGLPEILMLLSGLSQKFLEKNLEIHETEAGKGTILEVKIERGLGSTIDVILYEGHLSVGNEIVLGGKNGIIKTKIRALLEPKPLIEIRESGEKFANVKSVSAATGVKIAAPLLDDSLAGSPVLVSVNGTEEQAIKDELGIIQFDTELMGPVLKTDALGSLEALINLLELNGLKPKKADVGNVNRKDIIEAFSVKEKDYYKGVVFAFNVKIDPVAEEEARKHEIKIFNGNVIYKLIEDYKLWLADEREKQKRSVLEKIALPAKFQLLPGFVFRNSKPAIVGIKVLEGKLKAGIQVFSKNGSIGTIEALQSKGENLKEAKKGEEIALSISGMAVGKELSEGDELYSLIPQKDFEELQKVPEFFNSEEKELLREIMELKKSLKN